MAGIRKPRIINTSRILRSIWISRHISRIQLARDLGLNKSTISNIVNELIETGVILETSEGDSGPMGGRKPVQIELNRNFGYIIGLELRPESYTAVAVDLTGNILFSRTENAEHLSGDFAENVEELLIRLRKELEWIGTPILGAGIGISGIINADAGTVLGSIPFHIDEPYKFARHIEGKFDFPIYIENDANCCAWGELAFHRSRKLRNFLFTLVEFHTDSVREIYEKTSVGFGIVFEGKVYHGNRHSAGEFHSIFCRPNDLGQFRVSSENDCINEKPEKLNELIIELSKHLALFINTFNLGQVFLGGDIEHYQDALMPVLLKEIKENWSYEKPVQCEIRFSSLADKSVAYGAAGMALERLFREPKNTEILGTAVPEVRKTLTELLTSRKDSPART